MRDAVSSAQNAANTASATAGTYGGDATTIGGQLTPFLTRQMNNPAGMSQQDIGAQLASALAGSGGATVGLTGAANQNATAMRNPVGFSAALDAAARSRDKAAAGAAESIASKNADVKLQQQQSAESDLGKLYGTDVGAQLDSQGQVSRDLDAEVQANNSGWLQNALAVWGAVTGGGNQIAQAGGKNGLGLWGG